MQEKPLSSFPKFTKAKLGTKWIHIPTQKVYELRRYPSTPPQVGNLYLYSRQDESTIDSVLTRDWKLQ